MTIVITTAGELVKKLTVVSSNGLVSVRDAVAIGLAKGLLPVRAITNHVSHVCNILPDGKGCILADTPFVENGHPNLYYVEKENRQVFSTGAGPVCGDTLIAFRLRDF